MSDDTPEVPPKQCNICQEWFPATPDYFNRKSTGKDGFKCSCRRCASRNKDTFSFLPEPIPDGFKRCSKCKAIKPMTNEFFPVRSSIKSGFHAWCKICANTYGADHHEKNKERISKRVNLHYANHKEDKARYAKEYQAKNKEKIAEYGRQWAIKNREKMIKKRAEYNIANKEKKAQYNREYHAKNKHAGRVAHTRRRARAAAVGGKYTAVDIERQYKAQKGRCYYCNCEVGNSYEVDHIIPLSRGGSNGPENIAVACMQCNRSKGSKLPTEWDGSSRLL